MKKTHLLIALLFTILSYSQPAGYYTNANGHEFWLQNSNRECPRRINESSIKW